MIAKKLIAAAAYLRMSSDQQDTSIADQRREVAAYAEKHGYRIVKWYIDEGISGWKSKQRLEFQNLITDAEDGQFRTVLCWDQSRFSRFDPMEVNFYWHRLRVAGVTLETIKEGKIDWESLGGWLTASINQHGRAEYVRSLAADVVRGRRASIMAGRWSWPAPYGYKIENGRLALGDAAEIEVVRRIFRLRATGIGCRAIVKALTADGIKSPFGRSLSTTQINKMLHRQTYIGHMVVGAEQRGKFQRIIEGVQVFENMHPAIIDADLWSRVQKVNAERGKDRAKRRRTRATAHLSGLLVCGSCGTSMHSDTYRGLYVCGKYRDGNGCSCNRISEQLAFELVANAVRQLLLKGSVEQLTAHIEKTLAKRSTNKAQVSAASIQKQIAEVDRKLENAVERLLEVDQTLLKSVHAAMAKLKEQREGLVEKLEQVKPAKKPKSAKEIAAGLWELDTVLRKGDPATVRSTLAPYIDKIAVEFKQQPMAKSPHKMRYVAVALLLHFCTDCTTSSRQ